MIRKNNQLQNTVEENFWKREQEANFTRRKDISDLDYLTIPLDKIPQNLHTEAEDTLVALSSCQMLNLTGKTNTDLKLAYGVANLDALSAYDENFTKFVRTVPVYAQELLDAGQPDAAKDLLELAVSYHADASSIYTMLAELYRESGQTQSIQSLVDSAQEIDSLGKDIILEKLKTYLP
jgi:tetratricopeptide (TPR) repeat protein